MGLGWKCLKCDKHPSLLRSENNYGRTKFFFWSVSPPRTFRCLHFYWGETVIPGRDGGWRVEHKKDFFFTQKNRRKLVDLLIDLTRGGNFRRATSFQAFGGCCDIQPNVKISSDDRTNEVKASFIKVFFYQLGSCLCYAKHRKSLTDCR